MNGTTTTAFGGTAIGYSAMLQPDGKIVVAGKWAGDFLLARYLPDGTLDTSFGKSGKVTTNLGSWDDNAYSVALQPDGKIVVSGSTQDYNKGGTTYAVTRYNADGSLDTSFSTDGVVTTKFNGQIAQVGQSVHVQTDGKIVVTGHAGGYFLLARYNADGGLDDTFGPGGLVYSGFGSESYGAALHGDGRIVVAGGSGSNFAIASFNADGSFDTSFNTTGKTTTNFGTRATAYDVAVQSDGKVLAAGYAGYSNSTTYEDFALARYNADGSLDTSFGKNGLVTTDFGSRDFGKSVTLQTDGKILVAGYSGNIGNSEDFAVARYNTDGSLDPTFGSGGKTKIDFGSYDDAYTVIVQSDSNILLVGSSGSSFALARLTASGALDPSFAPVVNRAPTLAKAIADQTVTLGSTYLLDIPTTTFTDADAGDTLTYTVKLSDGSSLPTWLSFDAPTRKLYGTPGTSDTGTLNLQVTATDKAGASASDTFSIVVSAAHNRAPYAALSISDESATTGKNFALVIPTYTFADYDSGDVLSYSAKLATGATLPSWLQFNSATCSFSGTPTDDDVGTWDVEVKATDKAGLTASDTFSIKVGISSTSSASAVVGTTGDDLLAGNTGNNLIIGGRGDDTIDGGSGIDTASYSGNASSFSVTKSGSGFVVKDASGTSGTDTIVNVEKLQFADKTMNLTVKKTAAGISSSELKLLMELYIAFFNRVPDADGLEYWIQLSNAGMKMDQISDSFYTAAITFSSVTGYSASMTDSDFVKLIYKNVLGRTGTTAPPEADVNYWAGNLASGADTRGTLIKTMLNAAHSFKGDATWGWVADLLDNKAAVASKFAVDFGLGYNTSETAITQGMAIAAAVTPDNTQAAIGLIGIQDAQITI